MNQKRETRVAAVIIETNHTTFILDFIWRVFKKVNAVCALSSSFRRNLSAVSHVSYRFLKSQDYPLQVSLKREACFYA
jgi:hypothetical protein